VAPATVSEISTKEGWLQADGLQIRYLEAGSGAPLIVFPAQTDELFNDLLKKLAQSCRVISLDSASGSEEANGLGGRISHALASLGLERYSIMGISAGARTALALAIATPERIDRLILLSPLRLSEDAEMFDLAAVKTATLVLVGTRDTSGAIEAGRLCRERISSCHLSFVYGAGHGIAADRLDVCCNLIMEFLEQGEQFIIFRESQIIRP
jgi:pimeloyl-ACP methyl ester carboxylesterase